MTLEEQELEHMCDEERYCDLKIAEEESNAKLSLNSAAIPYDYGVSESASDINATPSQNPDEDSSTSSDDEDFVPSSQLRVPKEMLTPKSNVQNTVIEKTAVFVHSKGPQMEIILNAKQKSNRRFRFLDFDNPLHKYYKHVLKMVREKKYVPNFDNPPVRKAKKKKPVAPPPPESGSESDSAADGHYLHPSLLARRPPIDTSASSPVLGNIKEESHLAAAALSLVSNYKLGEEDDVYSELYNRLSAFLPKKEENSATASVDNNFIDSDSANQQAAWDYYANVAATGGIPPPPNIQPIIDRLADYVARNGVEFEQMVKAMGDERFEFLDPQHPYHAFYCSRVHLHQYEQYMSAYYGHQPQTYHVLGRVNGAAMSAPVDQQSAVVGADGPVEPVQCVPTTTAPPADVTTTAASTKSVDLTSHSSTGETAPLLISKSATELKPFEKADGQTISFSMKVKDRQHVLLSQQSEASTSKNEQTGETTINYETKVVFSLSDEDEDNHPIDALAGSSKRSVDSEIEDQLKAERKKKAKLFLDLIKRSKATVIASEPKVRKRRFDVMFKE